VSDGRAMAISVFLSTVSDEFRAYRDQLVHDLTRHDVAVKVQEDFKDLGGDTLDKLDVYIAQCDAVVHLAGDMCGAAADETQQQALLAKHSDLQSKLPPLGEALKNGFRLAYTQWEAWLALYYGKSLLIAKAKTVAPRGPLELVRLAQEYDLNLWRAFGVFLEGWASAASGASGSGMRPRRRAAARTERSMVRRATKDDSG
jgi:hypothetical protein